MLRRTIVVLFLATLLASSGGAAYLLLRGTGADMTTAAQKFLGSLDDTARAKATMGFDDPARMKWHFIPLPERKGLQVKEMNSDQRTAALGLLKACVSQVGYRKAEVIMGLEAILRELEKSRVGGPIRDPERYYWTVFGMPADDGTWGLSIEGHHLSLNFVVADGKLSSFTPAMFGANPATVHEHNIPGGAPGGTRILKDEEELGFALLASLAADQRKTAVIAEKSPADVRAAGEAQAPQTAPEGLPAKNMQPEQVKMLRTLLGSHLGNMTAEIAASRAEEIEAAGIENVYFAWAGADKPGIGHYYRVQGPTFVVEFVNVQPDAAGNPANHIHQVWRDLRGDFGLKAK